MISNYKLKKIKKNLEYFYNNSTEEQKINGINWYKKANKFCIDIANEYKINAYIVASVLSALSPRNKWEQNKKDTIKVFEAIKNGKSPEDIKVCTFNKNKIKAFNIAKGNEDIKKSSPKTFAFLKNISCLDSNFVTIDVWHLRACFDKMILKKSITLNEYKQVENLTINLAKKYKLKGYEFQAIVWENIRNNY